MIEIEVDPQFHGPTVAELAATLDAIPDDPLKVRWGGSREEARLLERLSGRRFIVCVGTPAEMGQAASQLGAALRVGEELAKAGKDALAIPKHYNWKRFSADVGASTARSVVVKLAADAVRQGKRPKLAGIAVDLLLGRASPSEADVLLRASRKERR